MGTIVASISAGIPAPCQAKGPAERGLEDVWTRTRRMSIHNAPWHVRYPSVVRAANGDLLLLFTRISKEQQEKGTGELVVVRSADNAASWLDPLVLYTPVEAEPRSMGTVTALASHRLLGLVVDGGGYAPMAMAGCVRKMVDLGHNFDVPVYPCISKSGMRGALASIEAWRGAAMNIWHTGADGVYTFNLFPRQRDDRFSEIGDVATLKGRDKFYGIDKFDTRGFLGIYKPGLVVPYALPVELEPDVAASVELPVGEDIVPNSPSGQNPSVKLRLQITNVLAGDSIETKVNGRDLPLGKWNQPPTTQPATRWYELEPDPTFIKAGTNRVEIRLLNDSPAERPPLSLVALKMPVGYR